MKESGTESVRVHGQTRMSKIKPKKLKVKPWLAAELDRAVAKNPGYAWKAVEPLSYDLRTKPYVRIVGMTDNKKYEFCRITPETKSFVEFYPLDKCGLGELRAALEKHEYKMQ